MLNDILTSQFKNLYNEAIDTILADSGLTVPCSLKYKYGNQNLELCYNCIYDPISMRSLNKYNSSGPRPFTEDTICPVCNGNGNIETTKNETLYLAVLFDSKYWFNWNSKAINVKDGMVQIICDIKHLPKLKNAEYIIINTNNSGYGSYRYTLAGDPEPCGLSEQKYIFSLWQRV